MRRAALLLLTCLLPACTVAVNTGRTSSIGQAFAGSWKGTGSQSDNPGVEWTIALTLAPGARGDVVGTITYPSLTCGGDLILRQADGGRVELLERITFGTCVDRGMITLAPSQGGLSFDWRDADGLTARGTLSRAQPPNP
jgi:hypothetical protein